MRTILKTGALIALATCAASCGGSSSRGTADAKRYEKYCSVEGFARAQRQTIVMVDENEITANPGDGKVAAANLKWTTWLGSLAGAKDSSLSANFAPRERLTLLVAPTDGSEPRLVFTGCLPFFSAQEASTIAHKQGSVASAAGSYFGSGAAQSAAKDAERFRSLFGAAVAHMGDAKALSAKRGGGSDFTASGLLQSLRHGGFVNLENGVPRVLLYSDLGRFTAPGADIATARKAGFDLATHVPLDLKRADVFVMGVIPSSRSERMREFAEAYLLGSSGALKAWGATDTAMADPAPQRVRVYSGLIRYGSQDVPMRLRLATTDGGRIVSSWVGITQDLETATPFSGDIVNDGVGGEAGKSDGRGLGQLWSLNPDPTPEWDRDMAFGGLRTIEFRANADGGLSGKISDPLVTQINGSATPYIPFKLKLDSKTLF